MHEDTLLGLAIIEATLSSLYVLLIMRHIARRVIAVNNSRLFLKDPKTLCSVIFVLIGVCDISLATNYLAYNSRGNTNHLLGFAISLGLHAFFCSSGLSVYFQILLHFLKSSLKLMSAASRQKVFSQLTILRNFSWLVIPFAIPISLSPILSTVYPDTSKPFGMTYIIGIGALLFLYSALFLTALGYIVEELTAHLKTFQGLDASVSSDALSLVCARLKLAYRAGGLSLLVGSILMMLFGPWDFLYDKFVYLSFVGRLNSITLYTVMYMTISGVPHNSSSTTAKGRKGLCYGRVVQVLGAQNQNHDQGAGATTKTDSTGMRGTSVKMSRPSTSKVSRESRSTLGLTG